MAAHTVGLASRARFALNASISLVFLLMAATVGVGAANFDATRHVLERAFNVHEETDLGQLTVFNTVVESEVTNLRETVGADRASISRFHNGKTDMQRIHFVYLSRTNESEAPGVASGMSQTQNLPVALLADFIESFEKNQCYVLEDTSAINTPGAQFYAGIGVKSIVKCPVFNEKGHIVAQVGVEYMSKNVRHSDVPAIVNSVHQHADKLTSLYQVQRGV